MIGASIIGFCIWAAIALLLIATSLMPQVVNVIGSSFFAITSLIICLTIGAFIGELLGKNKKRLQGFLINSGNSFFIANKSSKIKF